MKPILFLAACSLITGCSMISHTRPIVLDGRLIGYETEKASGIFSKVAVDGLSSITRDHEYSHTFRAKNGAVAGDPETITASSSALGALIGTATKTAVKP